MQSKALFKSHAAAVTRVLKGKNSSSEMKCSHGVLFPPTGRGAQPFLAAGVGCDLGLQWRSFHAELGTLGEEGTRPDLLVMI